MSQVKDSHKQKDRKVIRISNKRQITIPLKYYETLDLGQEVECVLDS